MAHGLPWWRDRVLKGALGGKPQKRGFGDKQEWLWLLPEDSQASQASQDAAEGEEAIFDPPEYSQASQASQRNGAAKSRETTTPEKLENTEKRFEEGEV
jgi:hypothetical protein